MKRKTKRVIWGFLSTDYKAMEEYLEGMARKGWMLEKVGREIARFSRIQPQELTFYVDVFKDEGPLVPENTPDSHEYRRLCEETGWHFITSQDYLQFFYAKGDQNPTPIQTDREIEQGLVQNSIIKREFLSMGVIMLAISRPVYHLFTLHYTYFLSIFRMVAGISILIFILNMLGMAVYFLSWKIKSKRCLKKGFKMKVPSLKGAKRRAFLFHGAQYLALLLLFVSLLGDEKMMPNEIIPILAFIAMIVGIGSFIRFLIKKKAKTKEDSSFYFIISIGLLVILIPIMTSFLIRVIDQEPDYTIDDIPEGYPMVTMGELLEDEQESKVLWRDFSSNSSPIIPMSYNLRENNLRISYYQSINSNISKVVFEGKVKELKKFLNYFHHSIIRDEELKERWGVEDLILSQKRDTIILRKDKYVLYLKGNKLDFKQEELIQTIMEEFFIADERAILEEGR